MKLSTLPTHFLLVLAVLFFIGSTPSRAATDEIQKGDSTVPNEKHNKKEDSTVPNEEYKTTLIDLYSWATILPKELIDLQNEITNEKDLQDVENELQNLSAEIDQIRWETTTAKTNPEIQLVQVTNLQMKSQRTSSRLNKITVPINTSISFLTDKRKEWLAKKEHILGFEKLSEIPSILGVEQYQKLIKTIDSALQLIEEQLKITLTIGKKIGDLQIVFYSIESDLKSLDADLKVTSIQQTAPSMLSAQFYSRIKYSHIVQSYNRTKRFIVDRLVSLQKNMHLVLFGLFAFGLVCFVIYKTQNFTPPKSRWQSFAKRPIATAVFMVSSMNAVINVFPLDTDLPEQWQALLHVLTLLAVMRLTKHLVSDKERRKLLNLLTFFLGMSMTLLLLGFPQILILLYVFYVSIAAFVYYLLKLPSTKGKKLTEVWIKRFWGILPAIVIISGLTGYDQLAVMAFSILLTTVIVCLLVWILYLFHMGLIELVLSLLPFTLIQENSSDIVKSIQPVLIWIHILMLITFQSVIWNIYPTFNEAFSGINNFGYDFIGLHISLKFIFTVGVVFYGAMLASKALQALLLKNVLPRYKAEKGVQLSITRLLHYAILTFGFLIILKLLGFQLSQLTLLGGALGVGIGFGLQAIVNNFVSGLILLFERPVKVGDTIQIGTEYGEVKQLGLRATIIQTFDNSEIVVPNSDLITGQVTNWTLAERKIRVKVPVGVAYGSDVTKVLQILLSCANENPMVLSTPAPNALFLAFGASSLDFELRVWIPEFLEKLRVLSDLNQEIDNEFAANNIEIPFPQSDLHLRSVDEKAGEMIRGKAQTALTSEAHSDAEFSRQQ